MKDTLHCFIVILLCSLFFSSCKKDENTSFSKKELYWLTTGVWKHRQHTFIENNAGYITQFKVTGSNHWNYQFSKNYTGKLWNDSTSESFKWNYEEKVNAVNCINAQGKTIFSLYLDFSNGNTLYQKVANFGIESPIYTEDVDVYTN
jgi:hypothetical protein